MGVRKTTLAAAAGDFVKIGPEIAERMSLEREPSATTVASYVLTRGTRRAWEAINNQLTGTQGALFWIRGAAGAGKTHFLNYVSALSSRAGALSSETARYLTLPIDVAHGLSAAEIERCVLESIDKALSGDDRAPALWRQMGGAEALAIALDGAHRQGVTGITIALDLGLGETAPALEILSALAQVAATSKHLRLIVVAAGRDEAPAPVRTFDVTPDADELMAVAIGRARRLDDAAQPSVDGLYRNLDSPLDPHAIYPLHPAAAGVLQSLHGPNGAVAAFARAVREAIEVWHDEGNFKRLIIPADLIRSGTVRCAIDARLGAPGRAAFRIANAAAAAIATDVAATQTIQAVVNTLVLLHFSEHSGNVPLDEIRARMDGAMPNGALGDRLPAFLTALAARTDGVIVYDARAQMARFNPRGAGAAEVAAFNSALVLLRHFDPPLTAMQERSELTARRERLDRALATALEGACRNRDTLVAAMGENNAYLSLEQQRAFAAFIELVEGGATALIELGADQSRRESAIAVVAAYEALAIVAESLPRLRIMREYLAATQLPAAEGEDVDGDRELQALELECQMLTVALNPGALAGSGRNLEALEARFQKFKWTYVRQYRAAHDQFRLELERLVPDTADAHLHLDALRRLNTIAALGAAAAPELDAAMVALEHRLAPCDFGGALAPEVTPCCPRCGYLLGALSPRRELSDLGGRAHRALQSKLATLAQSAISRLIRQNDSNHRLEGFLKIVQAAQTEALVRVLDDELALYLTNLLNENLAATDFGGEAAGVIESQVPARQRLHASGSRRPKIGRRNGRNRQALKAPPDLN
jgi:hypothetical protein